MYPRAVDLTSPEVRQYSDRELFWIAENGIRLSGMPAFGRVESDKHIWHVTPRHINAPAEYWPQKVLSVSSVNAAMQNYVSIYERQTRPNPALAVVHGQAAMLPRYDVSTYYVSREILAAALAASLGHE
jgi:hypothetical protein